MSFNWSHVASKCLSLQYHFSATNCGECPNATTTNMATCTGNYSHPTSHHACSFAVRTAVCNGIVGDFRDAIGVPTISMAGMHV